MRIPMPSTQMETALKCPRQGAETTGEKSAMNDDTQITPPIPNETSSIKPPNRLVWVFRGAQGLRAGWGVLIFIALNVALGRVAYGILARFITLNPAGPVAPAAALMQESCALLIVFFSTWLMGRIENRRAFTYGYQANNKITRLLTGTFWGFTCLSALVGVLWITGFLVFDGWSLHGTSVWKYALIWAFFFFEVGLVEESLLRGYLQSTLTRGIGFWWAAFLLSIVFALLHVSNGGESLMG